MAKFNSEKTISANSNGIVISYGDANKHQFVNYQSKNAHVSKIQTEGTVKYQKIERQIKFTPKQTGTVGLCPLTHFFFTVFIQDKDPRARKER